MAGVSDHGADVERQRLADRQHLTRALAEVAGGSEAALREVYSRTAAKLYGICLRILSDRQEAEDALQDIYLTIWKRADRFDAERASPVTWLATIARNRAIDRLRARGTRSFAMMEEAAQVPDPAPDPAASLMASQGRARIEDCLQQLEDRQAVAIRAAFFDGATYAELAEHGAVALGTLKSWIRRGLLKLRACLGE